MLINSSEMDHTTECAEEWEMVAPPQASEPASGCPLKSMCENKADKVDEAPTTFISVPSDKNGLRLQSANSTRSGESMDWPVDLGDDIFTDPLTLEDYPFLWQLEDFTPSTGEPDISPTLEGQDILRGGPQSQSALAEALKNLNSATETRFGSEQATSNPPSSNQPQEVPNATTGHFDENTFDFLLDGDLGANGAGFFETPGGFDPSFGQSDRPSQYFADYSEPWAGIEVFGALPLLIQDEEEAQCEAPLLKFGSFTAILNFAGTFQMLTFL
jgi:hypothetical protein